jgi:hypothetical protein
MKKSRALPVLAFLLGIGLLAFQAEAQPNYGPLFEYPAIKGQSAFSFLKVGQSPRSVGMGEAFAAMPGNIDAIFHNPGGLGFLQGKHYTFSYTKWLVDSKFMTGAIAARLGSNVFGLSVITAKPQDVEETTIYESLGTGRNISASEMAIGLTFARQMTDKVSWGIQGKMIREDLMLTTATSYQLDVGISAYTGYKSLRMAASARNVGGEVTVEVRPFNPPIYFNFGAAAEVYGSQDDPTYLTVSTETLFATDYGQRWNFGGEFWVNNAIAFRGGYKINYDIEDYALGVGLKHSFGDREIRVDVAYSDGGSDFDAPLRLSLGGSF